MICFEINPTARTIRAVDIPAIPDGYSDDPHYLNELGDVVYVERKSEATHGFVLEGVRAPMRGLAYIVGTNEDGDDVPPKVEYNWLVEHSDFGSIVPHGDMLMFTGDRVIRSIQN